jgi:hypothetical protein
MEKDTNNKKVFYIFLIIAVLGFILFYVVFWKKSADVKLSLENSGNYEEVQKSVAAYESALKADNYGGKTPKETISMFVEALKKEDVDLAIRYVLIDMNGKRDKWKNALLAMKNEGRLKEAVNILSSAVFDEKSSYGNSAWFRAKDQMGNPVDILLELNPYTQLWKMSEM